ncbi:hypothetical protein RUM44_006608 [Polyplax serrata]|uniref:Uncharacterized protein n=1 Tax=Polyplax serrata TaxID=468196 RepID=A0ABR1AIK3_POLSC
MATLPTFCREEMVTVGCRVTTGAPCPEPSSRPPPIHFILAVVLPERKTTHAPPTHHTHAHARAGRKVPKKGPSATDVVLKNKKNRMGDRWVGGWLLDAAVVAEPSGKH